MTVGLDDRPASSAEPFDYRSIEGPQAGHFSRGILPYRMFARAAGLYPGKVALVAPDRSFTYRDLIEATDRMASGLHALGVRPGHAVAAIMDNRWEHLPLFLAIARIGAVHATLNYLLPDEYILSELAELRCALVIGRHGVTIEFVMDAANGFLPEIFADDRAPLSIRHSSGTTGRSKKTIASQHGSALIYQELAGELRLTNDDVHLAVGSLAHAALQMALMQLTVGGTVIVHPFNKESVWQDCRRLGITNMLLMPTMVAMALEYDGELDRPFTLFTAGASLAAPLKRQLFSRFPQLRLYDFYLTTEAGHIASLRPSDQQSKAASSGRPYFSTEIGIFDDQGKAVALGERGDIYARGPMATIAYYGEAKPLAALPALAEQGWMRLGDIGLMDEDGYLHLSDRSADVFQSGGCVIYPSEIEAVIRECRGIREVAVIGIPSSDTGHRIVAYVEGAMAIADVERRCAELLASHQQPKVIAVDALPRTGSGKISRHLVREAVAANAFSS